MVIGEMIVLLETVEVVVFISVEVEVVAIVVVVVEEEPLVSDKAVVEY